jgi:thiosulfate dehydrogenase
MTRRSARILALAVPAALFGGPAGSETAPGTGVSVSLCDGESQLTLPGLKPGEVLPPDKAREAASQMLQIWRGTQGEARWASWVAEASEALQAPAPAPSPAASAAQADQPTKFTSRDQMLWKREEKKWTEEGYKAFHSAQTLGGTIGISCDMCHPDATNTHPETYPKFQAQTKKMALLRDMINWCIENPMKGKPLPENDPRLRAVEAYILSARKGAALEAGKH